MGPSSAGTLVFPGVQGGTNWYSPSYSPRTGLFYVPTWESYSSVFYKFPAQYEPGKRYLGGAPRSVIPALRREPVKTWDAESGYGAVRALDPSTGQKKWEFRMSDVTDSGILTTAADVLFTGGREGYFYALNARTGAVLRKSYLGGQIAAGPITYLIGSTQYVAIASGHSLFTFALPTTP